MILELKEKLTEKECREFKIPNTLKLDNFHGVQYAMCIGAVIKNGKKYIYYPEFSKSYIDTDITPNKLISFCELHKDIIIKEKSYITGHFMTIYYIIYSYNEKPMLINEFNNFCHNLVDIELTFNNNGYYSVEELHLDLSPNTSIINAIHEVFSNENVVGLKEFITIDDNNNYLMEYYNNHGNKKIFRFQSLSHIFNCITNIRLVGCQQQMD